MQQERNLLNDPRLIKKFKLKPGNRYPTRTCRGCGIDYNPTTAHWIISTDKEGMRIRCRRCLNARRSRMYYKRKAEARALGIEDAWGYARYHKGAQTYSKARAARFREKYGVGVDTYYRNNLPLEVRKARSKRRKQKYNNNHNYVRIKQKIAMSSVSSLIYNKMSHKKNRYDFKNDYSTARRELIRLASDDSFREAWIRFMYYGGYLTGNVHICLPKDGYWVLKFKKEVEQPVVMRRSIYEGLREEYRRQYEALVNGRACHYNKLSLIFKRLGHIDRSARLYDNLTANTKQHLMSSHKRILKGENHV